MRARGTRSADHPGTVSMHSAGVCKSCRRASCTPAKVGSLTPRKAPLVDEADMTFSLRPEEWTESARCARSDPERFHPSGWTMTYEWVMESNRRECASCPVRRQCLDYALGISERYGVWGGVDLEQTYEFNTTDGPVVVDFTDSPEQITLRVVFTPAHIRGRGHGAAAIAALCRTADRENKPIVTSVTGSFGCDIERLVSLFEEFDFRADTATPFAPGDVPMIRPAKVAA